MLFRIMAGGERVLSFAALCVLLPLLAAVAAVIVLFSGKAPLVAHRRVGHRGATLWMLKFRTMWSEERDASRGFIEHLRDEHIPEIKDGCDPRVTSRFAGFCRKHSIDELPQLWHVVRGEMSLVGPRPMTPNEWEQHYGLPAAEVLRLKPGMSGLWQTRGRNRLTYRQRRRLDIFLARHYCLWLYVRILGHTVPRVFAGRDAW